MNSKVRNLLSRTNFTPDAHPATCALVEFAAQNSGISPRNYFDSYADAQGVKAFREEQRSITQDWRRFRDALLEASQEGVTDAAVIAEAPHAFSGRLEWVSTVKNAENYIEGIKIMREKLSNPGECSVDSLKADIEANEAALSKAGRWEYTTGQYFPTEYRKAAATVLEYATRRTRQARPKKTRKVSTIAQLVKLNKVNGGCWFNPGEMEFFGTRIESEIIQGKYFVTSESPDGTDDNTRRKFSLRSFDEVGSVDTVGKFCAFGDKAEAVASIPK